MPSYTYTVEDYSPLITYSSGWSQGTSGSDSFAFRYSQSSFQATNVAGSTARFSFNGTGVQIFGAKRPNHGLYQVTVDGKASDPLNGVDAGNSFQSILYEVHDLQLGKHDVVVTNLDQNKYLDIDFVNIDGVVAAGSGTIFVNTVQDSDPSFSYLPSPNAWSASPNNLGTFSGSSGHVTSSSGASVSFPFTGDGVSLYGPLSIDGAPYSVSLDGKTMLNSTTIRDRYWPQSLLFQGMNLGEGKHNLQVFYQSTASGQLFAVDYANVYSTSQSRSSNGSSGGLSAGAAAGITAAACIILALIGAILFLLTRKRHSPQKESVEKPGNGTGTTPLMHPQDFSHPPSQTALPLPGPGPQFGSVLPQGHGNPLAGYHTNPSTTDMSSGYLPTLATQGHSYVDSVPMNAMPTRLEWRPTCDGDDGHGGQRMTPIVDSVPRSLNGHSPPQRLGPNGYPLEKRSRNEMRVVSMAEDDVGSSGEGAGFNPPGYAQTIQAGGRPFV